MPPGFTFSIELEGVDGKSGKVGSGRVEPMNVNDEQFTSSYLAKNTALLANNHLLYCSICQKELENYATDTLSTALCPNSSCTAISHITCLSKTFLAADPLSMGLVPRGGTCTSCNTYTLWGDVIRGSYRRMAGGTSIEIDEEGEEEDSHYQSEDELYASDSKPYSEFSSFNTRAPKRKMTTPAIKTRRSRQGTRNASSEGELFDSDSVSSTDQTPRKRGRPPKTVSSTVSPTDKTPRKCGRPPKAVSSTAVSPTDKSPRNHGRPPKAILSTTLIHSKGTKTPASSSRQADRSQYPSFGPIDVSSEGELFDSDCTSLDGTSVKPGEQLPIAPSPVLEIDSIPVLPRKRGRPRKVAPSAKSIPGAPTMERAASKKSQIGSKNYSTTTGHTGMADLSDEILDFNNVRPDSSEDHSMQSSPCQLSREISRGLQRQFPKGSGSMSSKTIQMKKDSQGDFHGQKVESTVDTAKLTRAMSSMFVTSPKPLYIEISD
ncbi:hypothetical protein C0992_004854 [Termitomyces sp. T32_za158]|nr:hypothetical protein C0992_004854 [Termitomyces sp. T32_za158]